MSLCGQAVEQRTGIPKVNLAYRACCLHSAHNDCSQWSIKNVQERDDILQFYEEYKTLEVRNENIVK